MAKLKVCLAFAAGLMVSAGAFAQDGFAGKWTVTQERQGQQRVSTLTIGENSGTWESERGTSELSNVKIENGKLTFSRVFERDGQEFSMEHAATIVDGKLVGTVTTPRGEREFTAVRAGDAGAASGKPSFVGSWDIEMEIQGNPVQAKLDVTEAEGALKGHWSSERGESDLDNLAVKDNTMTFSRTIEREGQEFTIDYTAKLVDGKLEGNMVTPMGDMPFTGTQAKAAAPAEGEEAAAMLKAMDTNGDGVVSEDEAPEQMKQFFSMIDADGSGGIDAKEMQTVVDFRRQQGGQQ